MIFSPSIQNMQDFQRSQARAKVNIRPASRAGQKVKSDLLDNMIVTANPDSLQVINVYTALQFGSTEWLYKFYPRPKKRL
jgi:hypothetical protein